LSIHVVEVPPLRDRPEDIEAFLRTFRVGRDTSAWDLLTPGALDLVMHHEWQGNFRELTNFAERLVPGTVSAEACRQALDQGSLAPRHHVAQSPRVASAAWSELGSQAALAFCEDHGLPAPQTWDDVKEYIEKYLKPLLFAHLSGADVSTLVDLDVRAHADRLAADRATALKQIERYFERFTR
jgi:DNA-binding NtrC family response regulator